MVPTTHQWDLPTLPAKLSRAEVHVWRTGFEQAPGYIARLRRWMTPDEQGRAERFHFEKHRNQFIIARGTLRALLGGYLDMDPAAIRFAYSDHGKPSLSPEHGRDHVRFNISHSHNLALLAFSEGRELGVDLEWMRDDVLEDRIAERFFSAEEVRTLDALPRELQREGFFNCWTRKEAYIKAIGEGLSMPLSRFVVTLTPGEPAALLSANGSPDDEEVSRWSIRELFPGAGYKGAVMAEGSDWDLRCWEWPAS